MNTVYALIHILSIIGMSTSILWLALRARAGKMKYTFMICQILIMIWSVSKIADLLAENDFQMYLSYTFGNIGVCFIGSAWVHFSHQYRSTAGGKKLVPFLYAVSAANYIAVLTNPLHLLYYGRLSVSGVSHGAIFYENVCFTYVCIIIGIVNICRRTFLERKYSRGQAVFVALAVAVPTFLNILFVGEVFTERFDPTPFGFAITSFCILFAVYRYDFLDVNYMTLPKIFKNIPEGIIIIDRHGEITYINDTASEYLSEPQRAEDVYRMIGDDAFEQIMYLPFSQTDTVINEKRLNISRYNHYDRDEKIIASAFIVTDVSRYYELVEKTRKLNAANAKVEVERERNRIAQEVHDTAGHTLTMINSAAKILRIKYPDLPQGANEYIDTISSEASTGITTLRMAVNNMKRYAYKGITDGINELVQTVKEIECEICVQGEETEKYLFCSEAVYRSCREAITNSLRYSGADRIDIIVKFLDSSLEVYIFDNGCGCSEINEGNGLSGIIRRIKEIGGEVSFMSSEGNGFTTAIKIPTGEKF